MCGIEGHFALSGLGLSGGIEPRALPWAIAVRPFKLCKMAILLDIAMPDILHNYRLRKIASFTGDFA